MNAGSNPVTVATTIIIMTRIQINQLIELLNTVKGHMTAQDVHEEFGYPADLIRRFCSKHNIVLLSHKERNLLYIKQVCHILTIDRIARNLGMDEAYIKRISDAAGVRLLQPEKPLFLEGRRLRMSNRS